MPPGCWLLKGSLLLVAYGECGLMSFSAMAYKRSCVNINDALTSFWNGNDSGFGDNANNDEDDDCSDEDN